MAEPRRQNLRDPRGKELTLDFTKGQFWGAGENASTLTLMGNALPSLDGGLEMCRGYQSLITDDFDGALGSGTGTDTAYAIDAKRYYGIDIHDENILIFRAGATQLSIWRKTSAVGYQAVGVNMRGGTSTYAKSLNDYSREPLAWADKSLTTEIQGWILHGNPSRDPYYQTADRIRSAFCVGLDDKKGQAEEYYNPGRIFPMVEAGYYTDTTNPKISFHGVPVPIITGQHKELPFGAPFGMGQVVDGDDLHFASSQTAIYGATNNSSTYSISEKTNSPTQRMFIAMENCLDYTAPNLHMFIAPHRNDQTSAEETNDTDGSSDDFQRLFWAIKSQDGGVNQEYSTTAHYNSGVTNIDDLRTGDSATDTSVGHNINFNLPHPVSVDFDVFSGRGVGQGDMTIAYVQRDPDAGTDRHSLIVKKYLKNSSGVYIQGATIKLTSWTDATTFKGVKVIHSPPDDQYANGCIYVVVNEDDGTDAYLSIWKIPGTGTSHMGWTDSTALTATEIRNVRAADNTRIGHFSIDLLPKAKDGKYNVLFLSALDRNDNTESPFIWHQATDSLNTASNDESLAINTMTELKDIHGFGHVLTKSIPTLIRAFKHNGKNMLGIMGVAVVDSIMRMVCWSGEFASNLFVGTQENFAPSSGRGHLYTDHEDSDKHDFHEKIAASNNSDTYTTDEHIYGYHGDMQGRFHLKFPNFNRWYIRKEATEENDYQNYVGRCSYNFLSGTFDVWNPALAEDDDKENEKDFSEQAGCRPGVLGDSNGLLPTRLGPFLMSGTTKPFDDYDHGGISLSKNGATCMFPTSWNGNCALMYPHYPGPHANDVHGATTPKRLDMVIHGTIYGGSQDAGHPYLSEVTEGTGTSKQGEVRPYPSNNLWTGANMNPLTPIVNIPDGQLEGDWHPKTDTGKKPILAGLDINLLERVTIASGDIPAGKYRYKVAFAKSGAGNRYRNTGAEGNVFSHNKLDAYFEVDLTEAGGSKGVKLQFNKPLLEGRTLFNIQAAHDASAAGKHYIKPRTSMAMSGISIDPDTGVGSELLGNRAIGQTFQNSKDGWYTHFDHYSAADIITNPYLDLDSTAKSSLKYLWAIDMDGTVNNSKAIYVSYVGNQDTTASSNLGLVQNIGAKNPTLWYGLHLTDSTGTNLDLSSGDWNWIGSNVKLGRTLIQGNDTELDPAVGGGLIHFGPEQDRQKPYIRYIMIYRTGDVSKASTDKESYVKVGEIDLLDDVNWDSYDLDEWIFDKSYITFLDVQHPRHVTGDEAHYLNGMMPVEGDQVTAMAASGNRLWVAYNDTPSGEGIGTITDKHKVPSTLLYSGEHWEDLSVINSVIVDDNAVIHSLKDFNGALWIFTDRGSYVIPDTHSNPGSSNFRVIKKSDFVVHNHPNDSERFLRIEGRIFVLGQDGLYQHDPNPMSTQNFKKISDAVGDFFKFHKQTEMGLYYNKTEESIICYSKVKTSAPHERKYTEVDGTVNASKRIHTVNFHLPTKSWWSYVESSQDSDNWYEQVDDIIPIVTDPNGGSGSYTTYASGKYSFDPITLMLRDAASAGSPSLKQVEIVRLGHVYGPFTTVSSAEELASQDSVIQTSWLGQSEVERYWNEVEIDYMPPIPAGDTHIKFEINIDKLNPWAKEHGTGGTLDDASEGNATPIALGEELSSTVYTKEITSTVYDNTSQGIPMRVKIPIKVKSEFIRLRLTFSLRNNDGDILNNGKIDTDRTAPKINKITFRTKFVGIDRNKS